MFASAAQTNLKVNNIVKPGKKTLNVHPDDKDDAAPVVVDPHQVAIVRIAADAEAARMRIKTARNNIVVSFHSTPDVFMTDAIPSRLRRHTMELWTLVLTANQKTSFHIARPSLCNMHAQ
jgi:hypothetical protein